MYSASAGNQIYSLMLCVSGSWLAALTVMRSASEALRYSHRFREVLISLEEFVYAQTASSLFPHPSLVFLIQNYTSFSFTVSMFHYSRDFTINGGTFTSVTMSTAQTGIGECGVQRGF